MEIIDCIQGTPEWFEVRRGIPSASNFDKIVTSKGIASKSATKYMYKLAGEYVSGYNEESYQNMAMIRGSELEAEARELYELIHNVEVKQVGFCLSDGYGCSPDGLVGDDGQIEIKCPSASVHVEYLLKGVLPTTYFQQVHGSLLVTGRKWCDFVSYYPGIKPLIVRVNKNTSFTALLSNELKSFCAELGEIIKRIGE